MTTVFVTNNPLLLSRALDAVVEVKGSPLDVFLEVRRLVMLGYRLLSHPLSGSMGPGVSPYKSVLLTDETSSDKRSDVEMVDKAIQLTMLQMDDHKHAVWGSISLIDLQQMDLDLLGSFTREKGIYV